MFLVKNNQEESCEHNFGKMKKADTVSKKHLYKRWLHDKSNVKTVDEMSTIYAMYFQTWPPAWHICSESLLNI